VSPIVSKPPEWRQKYNASIVVSDVGRTQVPMVETKHKIERLSRYAAPVTRPILPLRGTTIVSCKIPSWMTRSTGTGWCLRFSHASQTTIVNRVGGGSPIWDVEGISSLLKLQQLPRNSLGCEPMLLAKLTMHSKTRQGHSGAASIADRKRSHASAFRRCTMRCVSRTCHTPQRGRLKQVDDLFRA
jgi:hypothetical protein